MRTKKVAFASGLSPPHVSSLLDTMRAWRSKRREMKTGKTKSKFGSLQLCWLQFANAAKPWAPKRRGVSPCKGCHFTPSPLYQLTGPSLAKHCFFGLCRARRSGLCFFSQGAGKVCTGKEWQLSPKSHCYGYLSSSLSHPWGLPTWVGWLV